MRRLSRAHKSFETYSDISRSSPTSRYLCAACRARQCVRQQRSNFSTSLSHHENISFSEKLRRKIWGTDTPPGAADPYSESGLVEKARKQSRKPAVADEGSASGAAGKLTRLPKKQASVEVEDPDYVPATTWDGLEQVGGQGGWWKKHWDPEHRFQGFMPVDRLTNPQEITVALHRAVVEVYTFHQADKPLSDLSSSWDSEDLTRSVQISPSSNGQEANLFFPDQEIRAQILSSNTASQAPLPEEVEEPIEEFEEDVEEKTGAVEENQEAAESTLEESRQAETGAVEMAPLDEGFLEEAKQKHLQGLDQQIASWDRAWLSVPLTSPDIKFAVLKRTLRLTGHRISDPTISTLTTVSSLLAQLIKPPKPKKLAEILVADDKLQQLPNLQIHDRRVTPIDREKAVGRWKVIEKELTKRGLPVTGSG